MHRRLRPSTLCTTNSSSLGAHCHLGQDAAGVFGRTRHCSEAAAVASRRHRAHYRKILTSSTKPEVHDMLQRWQKRNE